MEDASTSSSWTPEEDKAFEVAVACCLSLDCSVLWEEIVAFVPGKTMDEIKLHFEILWADVKAIEAGLVPLPEYVSSSDDDMHCDSNPRAKKMPRTSDQERRKGTPWSPEEHSKFLCGLEAFGKGDWRSISRHCVQTRTPTQVASHAQKFFLRHNSTNKEKRRSSIHDITSVDNGERSFPQEPTPGQANGPMTTSWKSANQASQLPVDSSGFGLYYGTTMENPVFEPLVPAVGSPINLPAPVAPHMASKVRSPVSGTRVSGAPKNRVPGALKNRSHKFYLCT